MPFRRCVALFFLFSCFLATASGQPPIYQPYGAWRGKIHYVEGPHRVRTHVRWGGGLTPVGGQVLMHLTDVAGQVATNPDFLKSVTGRKAALSPELLPAIESVDKTNREVLLANVNEVRASVGLSPLTLSVRPSSTPNAGGPFHDPVQEMREVREKEPKKDDEAFAALENLRQSLSDAVAIGTKFKADLTPEQQTILTKLNGLAAKSGTLPAAASFVQTATKERFQPAADSVTSLVAQVRKLAGEEIELLKTIIAAPNEDPDGTAAQKKKDWEDVLGKLQGF